MNILRLSGYIICCLILTMATSLIIGIIIGYRIHNQFHHFTEVLIKTSREKCKEYVNVACIQQNPPAPKLDQEILPHQVLAYLEFPQNSNSEKKTCSGSLISERFILTAAHCVDDVNLREGTVLLGTLDGYWLDTTPRKKIKKVYIHSDYTKGKFAADICLLELEENLELYANMRPCCLNTRFEKHYDSIIASGWGTSEDWRTSKHLKMADLYNHTYSDEKTKASCRSYFQQDYETLDKMNICFANLTEGINQNYDNGGPLQVKLPSVCPNTWEQVGVTSMFAKNDHKEKAFNLQLFVKVEYFVPWISNIVWHKASTDNYARTITIS